MSDRTLSPQWRLARAVAIVLAAVLALLWLVSRIPNLNPFATETTDRTQPALLQSTQFITGGSGPPVPAMVQMPGNMTVQGT